MSVPSLPHSPTFSQSDAEAIRIESTRFFAPPLNRV